MAFDFQMDQIMNKIIIGDFNGSKHLQESKVHREIVVDPKKNRFKNVTLGLRKTGKTRSSGSEPPVLLYAYNINWK